jgi:lipopolysaccharide export system protein LptA
LLQGNTAIRADVIVLDQQKGDLVASGSALSSLTLDAGQTDGRANEIRYDEAKRIVTYSSAGVAPTTGQSTASPLAQVVSGSSGDLRAERIEIVLEGQENAVDRLEAYTRVTMVLGQRTATGGRLTYHAKEERYLMSASGATAVTLRESCQETTGRTVTFFKSTDKIIVDGDETRRTETKPCKPQPSTTPRPSPPTR